MSIHDEFKVAGEQYAEQLRKRGQDASATAATWLGDRLANLEEPEQPMTNPSNNSDDFNRFFGIK